MGGGGGLRQTRRVGAYVAQELGHDVGVIAVELAAGLAGIVGLGVVEGTLALQQGNGGAIPAPSQRLRYALLTTWPSLAGRPLPSDVGVRGVLHQQQPLAPRVPALKAGAIPLRLRNVQAGRQLVAFATVVGVTLQVGSSVQRGRARYQQHVHEGREPPLAPPPAVRISHRAPVPGGTAPAFHVALATSADDRVPWWTASGAAAVPRRWWSRAGWIQDPREWAAMLPASLCASAYSKASPLFLEVEVATAARSRGLSLDLALESLRAGGQARGGAAGDGGVVRILLAGGEVMRPLARRCVEESGAVDLLVDGEAAVAVAVLSWMEKTPYASAWAALAAQRTREEEAKISARREGNPLWKGYEQMNAWVERMPVATVVETPWQWVAGSWEALGRRLRWLVKGGVTARDALEEYKVLVLVHDADAARLGQRLKLKELLQGAGWDVWGPGTSASRLVQDKDALVPVLVYCQDDATTLERARFLIRAGRPPQLTCALLEDPESACPWLAKPHGKDEARPTVLSVADIHDSLFAFVRARVKEGRTLPDVQHELDTSTRVKRK